MLNKLFGRRELIIVGAVVLTVTLIALIVVFAVYLSSRSREPQRVPELVSDLEAPRMEDMLLPDPRLEAQMPRVRLLREPREVWDDGDIQRFWLDPADIAREHLLQYAEDEIDRLLGVDE